MPQNTIRGAYVEITFNGGKKYGTYVSGKDETEFSEKVKTFSQSILNLPQPKEAQ